MKAGHDFLRFFEALLLFVVCLDALAEVDALDERYDGHFEHVMWHLGTSVELARSEPHGLGDYGV